jgi:hypothetical protein
MKLQANLRRVISSPQESRSFTSPTHTREWQHRPGWACGSARVIARQRSLGIVVHPQEEALSEAETASIGRVGGEI